MEKAIFTICAGQNGSGLPKPGVAFVARRVDGAVIIESGGRDNIHVDESASEMIPEAFAYRIDTYQGEALAGSKLVFCAKEEIPAYSDENPFVLGSNQQWMRADELDTSDPNELLRQVKDDSMIAFVVAAKSENTNSFGLQGHVMVAKNGIAYEVGRSKSHPNQLDVGSVVVTDKDWNGIPNFAPTGFEIPRALPAAPRAVVNEAWEKARDSFIAFDPCQVTVRGVQDVVEASMPDPGGPAQSLRGSFTHATDGRVRD